MNRAEPTHPADKEIADLFAKIKETLAEQGHRLDRMEASIKQTPAQEQARGN